MIIGSNYWVRQRCSEYFVIFHTITCPSPISFVICTCQPVKPEDLPRLLGVRGTLETARLGSAVNSASYIFFLGGGGSWAMKCHSTVILTYRSNRFFFCVQVCKWKRLALKVGILKLFVLLVLSGENVSALCADLCTVELTWMFSSLTFHFLLPFFFIFLKVLKCL